MSNCKECNAVIVSGDYCALCAVAMINNGGVMKMTDAEIEAWFIAHAVELEPVIESNVNDVDSEGNVAIVYTSPEPRKARKNKRCKVRETDEDAVIARKYVPAPRYQTCPTCKAELEDNGARCPECGNYVSELVQTEEKRRSMVTTDGIVYQSVILAEVNVAFISEVEEDDVTIAARQVNEEIDYGKTGEALVCELFMMGMNPGEVLVRGSKNEFRGFATKQEVEKLEDIEIKYVKQDYEVIVNRVAKRNEMKAMAKRVVDGYSKKIVNCKSKDDVNVVIDTAIDVFKWLLKRNFNADYVFPSVRALHPSTRTNKAYLEAMELVVKLNKEIAYFRSAMDSGVISDIGEVEIQKLNAKIKSLDGILGRKLNAELYSRMRKVLFAAWVKTQPNHYEIALNTVLGLIEGKSDEETVQVLRSSNLSVDTVKMALAHARFLLRNSQIRALPPSAYYCLLSMGGRAA